MAHTRIIDTIDTFLPEEQREEILATPEYKALRGDYEYFEQFVDHEGVPDVVGVVQAVIAQQVPKAANPFLTPTDSSGRGRYVFSTTPYQFHNRENVKVEFGLYGLGVKSIIHKEFSEPSISVHRFGSNKYGFMANAIKGVEIRGYKLTQDMVAPLLKEFTKLEGERDDIILGLAHSDDVTECYPPGHWVQHQKQYIDRGETPQPGIDASRVYVIEQDLGAARVFGNIHGLHSGDTMSLIMRIETPGTHFQFPHEATIYPYEEHK